MLIQDIEYYLDVRRATGYDLTGVELTLRQYAAFAEKRNAAYVTVDTAVEWAGSATSKISKAIRLSTVTRFARFMKAQDERYEIPPSGIFPHCRYRPAPYIFSEIEIKVLIDQSRRLTPEGSLRPYTYSTIFSLLAVTGMRVSEALNLQLDDLTRDGLVIRKTKFRKSRIIPLHETSEEALRDYLIRRLRFGGGDPHLFVSLYRKKLSYYAVRLVFRQLCNETGIVRVPGGSPPGIHSLRHTFATRALESCSGNRDNVTRHICALATYLGHSGIESSYWYLDSTPRMMRDIADSFETFVKGGPE